MIVFFETIAWKTDRKDLLNSYATRITLWQCTSKREHIHGTRRERMRHRLGKGKLKVLKILCKLEFENMRTTF